MATTVFNTDSETSGLPLFSFGMPAEQTPAHSGAVNEETRLKPRTKPPGRSTAGDVAVALVILAAAVVGCFGINSEMVIRYFPQVAAVLHLSAPAQDVALPSGTNAQIKVWVDLKTALYYCPGSDSYGRTRSGRFLSQTEARLANFEPAERKECTAPSSAMPAKGGLPQR
jgi:hypothetical protein